jgi:RNA polymerase sigma-54 factor
LAASLRQGFRLLVLDRDELRQAIATAVSENPFLEAEGEGPPAAGEGAKDTTPEYDPEADPFLFTDEPAGTAEADDSAPPPEAAAPPPPLHLHLSEQIACLRMNPRDRALAEHLLDRIDERGYLGEPLEELRTSYPGAPPPETEELEAVRHRLQGLDPVGCFALDLGDCLRAQAQRRDDIPAATRTLLLTLLTLPLPDLAHARNETLARRLARPVEEIARARRLLRLLDPAPGTRFGGLPAVRLLPDLVIESAEEGLRVRLSDDGLPRLRIRRLAHARSAVGSADWRRCRDEARGFLHGLALRRRALLALGEGLLRHQKGFFYHGATALVPLRQRTLAAELGIHESTLSRLVQSKYILSPQGLHPLKFFFPPAAGGAATGEEGPTPQAIHAALVEILGGESPERPYRDGELAGLLAERGIMVARRTVSKYRQLHAIPAWRERHAPPPSSEGDERR